LKADTVDYAQQDNNSPNDANSKDVDQQATKINADQEHYGDVKENVLSDQEVSESLPLWSQTKKVSITYEDKKNIQSDEETTGQSHSNNSPCLYIQTKELIFMMRNNNMEKERKTSTLILVSQKVFVLKIETKKEGNWLISWKNIWLLLNVKNKSYKISLP